MNKGFKFYYKDGLRKARKAFKKKKNLGKYYAYLLSSLIGRIVLFLFMPAFGLSDYRLARMVRDGENITLSKVYDVMDRPKNFWTCILAGLNTILIFLGGLLIILIPTGALGAIGYLIAYILANPNYQFLLPAAFMVPGALVTLVYLFIFPFYISPLIYIISNVDGVNSTDALKNSFKAMKEGKGTLFGLFFVHFIMLLLLTALIGGIGFGLVYYLPVMLYNANIINDRLLFIVRGAGAIVTVLLLFFVYFRILPVRLVGLRIARMGLYDDILVKYDSALEAIYVKGVKVEKTSLKNYKDNLIRLFDETTGYSKYEEPKQESVEVIKESTVEEVKEEYLTDEKKVEELANEAHEEIEESMAQVEEPEEEKPLSKAELKALKKAEKKNKKKDKHAKDEEPQKEEDVEQEEVQEQEQTEEVPETPVVEEAIEEMPYVEPTMDEAPVQEPVQEEPVVPDFHQEYDNEEDGPLFSDEPAEEAETEESFLSEPTEEAEVQAQETPETLAEEAPEVPSEEVADEPEVPETPVQEEVLEETQAQETPEVPSEEVADEPEVPETPVEETSEAQEEDSEEPKEE